MPLAHGGAGNEAGVFQGRRAELGRVLGLLDAPGQLPRVVRVHGPAGIGKTAFAHALARECAARGWQAVILDSRDFCHDTAALAEAVTAHIASAQAARAGRPLLLVLDTFEEMADIERDLWDVVLPSLKDPVLVALSGRQRARVRASSGSWHGLVDDVELGGLTEAESRRLVRLHGVGDRDTIAKILAFASGNPLLLTVAAQHAVMAGGVSDADLSGTVTRSLIVRMTREIADPAMRQLLEAASLVRTFNQELLAAMLGRDISGAFDALCELSFVRVVRRGARLHDLVRGSVAEDLRGRAPDAYQTMRRRAHAYLTQLAATSAEPGPCLQELLYLAARLPAQARFYAPADDPEVHVRPACPDDLPQLTRLCHTGVTRYGFPPAERARQLEADFPVAQQHFAIAEDGSGLITGFSYSIWLSSATWQTAAKTRQAFLSALPGPELAAITAAPEARPAAILDAGTTHLRGHDHVDAVLRGAFFAMGRGRRSRPAQFTVYYLLTTDCLDLPQITAAALTKRTTNLRLGGCLADEWLLRLGEDGFAGWIGQALEAESTAPGPSIPVR